MISSLSATVDYMRNNLKRSASTKGQMGHGSDKLYITHSEHASQHAHSATSAGFQKKQSHTFASLPFSHCALSLQPFETPVCNAEGICYDLLNIIPYLKKHSKDPVTGKKLTPGELIRLNFAKNADDNYHDPLTFRVFTNHTPIVAIRKTGNVFSKDSVDRLNVKANFWKDLLTDEPFTREDIIVLQDPHNPDQRNLSRFKHLDADLKPVIEQDESTDGLSGINVGATGGASALIKSISAKQKAEDEKKAASLAIEPPPVASTSKGPAQPWNTSKLSTGRSAASLTSTAMPVHTETDRMLYDEETLMFEAIKDKGYVQLKTNFGDINLELFCDKAPRTCYNFLSLAKNRKYDDTIFHRLIPGFMIQGGDRVDKATGTGRGGESIWGQPFSDEYSLRGALKHDKRGMLSMANSGPNTNSSQLECPHLNGKHTVFGRVVGSTEALDRMEQINVQPSTNRPLKPIKLFDASVFKNPYEEYQAKQAKNLERDSNMQTGREAQKRKRKERDNDRTTWFGHTLDQPKVDSKLSTEGLGGVGKYLKTAPSKAAPTSTDNGLDEGPKKKRNGGAGGFGDFSGW